ncbi:unnamed protein product [Fraxinus pennsylvanica]|uniref:Carbohydrate kinase PfkB domain-containing protein n=1 Tax=Fraxinus pennsylvanica TaxID=56036 RepID=A0AAD1Z5T8_9LAMI|nr:unnamed protein product [Fraxinus pennsylvanica]
MQVAKDARELLPYKIDDSAMSLWHDNLKLCLPTLGENLGEKGCRYYNKLCLINFHGSINGNHVKAIYTTGAGDSFVGALHGIIQDEPKLKECLKFACACRAIITTKKGAIPLSQPRK